MALIGCTGSISISYKWQQHWCGAGKCNYSGTNVLHVETRIENPRGGKTVQDKFFSK